MEEIFIPALGQAMTEADLVEWLVQPGEAVSAGADVAVIETDKSTVEVAAETAGRLSSHRFPEGARISVGAVIAYVLADDEAEPDAAAGPSAQQPPPAAPADTESEPDAESTGGSPPQRRRLSPRARRLAQQEPDRPATDRDGHRSAVAAAVTRSWHEAPHFSVGRDFRAEGVRYAVAQARAGGESVTVTDVLLRAWARALTEDDADPPSVGLAVATDRGVAIPVVTRPGTVDLAEVARRRTAAVERARAGKAVADDAAAVPATLSNLGAHAVRRFTGVLPVGQALLLTVGAIVRQPVVEGDRVVVGEVFDATLTLDHRRHDGVHGAEFLDRFARALADVAPTPSLSTSEGAS